MNALCGFYHCPSFAICHDVKQVKGCNNAKYAYVDPS